MPVPNALRTALACAVVWFFAVPAPAQETPWPTAGWPTATPADVALDAAPSNGSTKPSWRTPTDTSTGWSWSATLIGIALARGEIAGLDAPLLSFFDDYDLSGVDARLHRATLADLLTMRAGIEWHEQGRSGSAAGYSGAGTMNPTR